MYAYYIRDASTSHNCSSPKLQGHFSHEIYFEIHANHVLVVYCVTFDFHDKLGYKIVKVRKAGHAEREIIPGGISFGKATVCETLYGPFSTGH
jgi:hypothetical protein